MVRKFIFILVFGLCTLPMELLAGPKTDTVYLFNGDRITGELKHFEYGMLFFKTDGMGTLKIEFDRIKTFYSKQQFTVQLSNGLRFLGSIDTSGTDGYVNLSVNSFRIPEPISAIVEMYSIDRTFWRRLNGAIDVGYSYTKASTLSQFNASGYIDYRVAKSYTRIDVNSILTDQQDRNRIRKQDYSLLFNRLFKNAWFSTTYLGGQQNTELGINHRFYGGAGVGNDLVHNNMQVLSGSLGLLISTERSEADSIIQSLEGAMQWRYKIFKFNDPEVELSSNLNVYPSFTSWGRVRLEFEIKAKIELFSDFYFGLNFYDNFDSQPLDPAAANNDWGITSSFGYSW